MYLRLMLKTACLVFIVSCGAKKEEDKANTSSSSDDNAVTMTGTLAISNSELALLADLKNIDIFCQDYSSPPKTCTIDVASDGAFSGSCAELVSTRFSCSVRENGYVIGDLPMGDLLSLVAGKGKINFDAIVNPDTGISTSTVDKTASDGLSSGSETGTTTPYATNLPGSWKATCVTSGDGVDAYYGIDDCPNGKTIYFSKTTSSGVTKISPWRSKKFYDACTETVGSTTYSEIKPNLHITINGDEAKIVTLDLTSAASFTASMTDAYALLPTEIASSIDSAVDAIVSRATELKTTVDAIRTASSSKFGGVLKYEIPDPADVQARLLMLLLNLKETDLDSVDFCNSLIADETLPSKYRRVHSLKPELICQLVSDELVTTVKTFITKTHDASCMPKLFFDLVYNTTSKSESNVLLCKGSQNSNGSCYDSKKNFIGDIEGRDQVLSFTDHPEGLFDMLSEQIIQKTVVHPTKGLITCDIVNRVSIKGKSSSTSNFEAVFSEQSVDRCQGLGASKDVRDFYGNFQSAQVSRYANTWRAVFAKQP